MACSNSELSKCKPGPRNQLTVHCREHCSAQHDQRLARELVNTGGGVSVKCRPWSRVSKPGAVLPNPGFRV